MKLNTTLSELEALAENMIIEGQMIADKGRLIKEYVQKARGGKPKSAKKAEQDARIAAALVKFRKRQFGKAF